MADGVDGKGCGHSGTSLGQILARQCIGGLG